MPPPGLTDLGPPGSQNYGVREVRNSVASTGCLERKRGDHVRQHVSASGCLTVLREAEPRTAAAGSTGRDGMKEGRGSPDCGKGALHLPQGQPLSPSGRHCSAGRTRPIFPARPTRCSEPAHPRQDQDCGPRGPRNSVALTACCWSTQRRSDRADRLLPCSGIELTSLLVARPSATTECSRSDS